MIENKHVKKMLQLLIGHIILTFQKVRHQKKKGLMSSTRKRTKTGFLRHLRKNKIWREEKNFHTHFPDQVSG